MSEIAPPIPFFRSQVFQGLMVIVIGRLAGYLGYSLNMTDTELLSVIDQVSLVAGVLLSAYGRLGPCAPIKGTEAEKTTAVITTK